MNKIKEYFNTLTPENKRKLVITITVVGMILLGLGMYLSTRGKPVEPPAGSGPETEIKIQPGLLEKSLYMQQQAELEKRSKEIEALKKEIEEMKKAREAEPLTPPPAPPVPEEQAGIKGFPPPPAYVESPPTGEQTQTPTTTEITIGDVVIVSSPKSEEPKPDLEEKKKRTIYLPPSFMEATLLSGLDAPTSMGGKSNPIPVLIRIKDLAVLPNDVKARVKGCFVIAEGIGNLASERAELRVVSLTCLDRKGKSVIDSDVDGVVVDQDGKVGLRGKVVAKMGSAIARSALAGFFGGVGEGIKAASTTQTVTPLGGTTTNVKPEDILKVGVGTGIANAFGELQKFYMELARQTLPVIEVGAGRTVTVIVTKGKSLEVKETCGGDECLF